MKLFSAAFAEGETIPPHHTCTGPDVSPPLSWTDVPSGAQSLVLIVDDPDAPVGTWLHWLVYDLPATVTGLAEAIDKTQYISSGGKQGLNDFRHLGYGGPCPPAGKPHRYFFRLFALDSELGLNPGARRDAVERMMKGHIVAEASLMGTFRR